MLISHILKTVLLFDMWWCLISKVAQVLRTNLKHKCSILLIPKVYSIGTLSAVLTCIFLLIYVILALHSKVLLFWTLCRSEMSHHVRNLLRWNFECHSVRMNGKIRKINHNSIVKRSYNWKLAASSSSGMQWTRSTEINIHFLSQD